MLIVSVVVDTKCGRSPGIGQPIDYDSVSSRLVVAVECISTSVKSTLGELKVKSV